MSRGKPGRVRVKLAKMLTTILGQQVRPGDIWDNNYPEARMVDVARWGVYLKHGCAHSWDTMSSCVRHGMEASSRSGGDVEISSKEE